MLGFRVFIDGRDSQYLPAAVSCVIDKLVDS